MKYLVIYNPYSGNSHGKQYALELKDKIKADLEFYNMLEIEDYKKFLHNNKEDIIVCGGDGTLNYFINHTKDIRHKNNVLYYSTGTGNDFYNDVGDNNHFPFNIDKYIKYLPTLTVNGEDHYFLNGVGIGVDGVCCEKGDELKLDSDKPVNYTSIAIKTILFDYKPCRAKVIVDGMEFNYDKVYIAAVMNGGCFGGGIKISPKQDRLNSKHTVTVVVVHSWNKYRTLLMFPKIVKGQHENYPNVSTFTGKEVKVIFDKPCALQMDGEVFKNVSEYVVRTPKAD